MTTYADLETLALNPTFQARCLWALRVAAENIRNESAGTTNHAARLAYANKVILGTRAITDATLAYQVLRNSTIQAAGFSALDSDIQFQINSVIDPDLIAIG